jgi:hypothetical protein
MTDPEKAEYERVIVMLTAKVEELVAANAVLKADLTAHSTLRAIYSDTALPATVRVRAAQAALNVETPPLKPQPPVLDLVGEEIEDLASLVHRRRKRQEELCPESASPGRLLPAGRRNGNFDDTPNG